MSYTSKLTKDYLCNYINPNTMNANQMLLSCINSPEEKNENDCNSSSVNIPLMSGLSSYSPGILPEVNGIVEGFSSDMTSGPGVSYVGEGECSDGQTKMNGKCYQVCRGCNYNDSSGYFGDSSKYPVGINTSHDSSCGTGYRSQGTDYNGFIRCKKDSSRLNTLDDDFNIAPYV
jgi:hypothetical protein